MTSIFCAGYTQYNGTGHPSSLPSLAVELKSDGNTLGFGFSSTDPKSTSGITNITEMPLSLSSELDSETGKITLIGRTSFYIWWQIQLPKENGSTVYSFYVRKGENLENGIEERFKNYVTNMNRLIPEEKSDAFKFWFIDPY